MTDGVLSDFYRGELAATIRVPATQEPATLVVIVPGGGWSTADPTDLVPLAQALTKAGSTTSLITYSTTWAGARFPQPADDVACAVRWSALQATALGYPPTRVIVAGHSAGGHLAALAALSGDRFGGDCAAPPVKIDGLIGMAGVYDTTSAIGGLSDLFEGNDTAETRIQGSPLEWARSGTAVPDGLRALLIHGDADTQVPVAQSQGLADALIANGVDVQVTLLTGQQHNIILPPDNVVPAITLWLAEWP